MYGQIMAAKLSSTKIALTSIQSRRLEDKDDKDSPMFRYVIYAILILCVLGFMYFVYNWLKCVLSRPKELEDSSDEEDEYVDNNRKNREMEMKNVLP